MTDPVRLTGAFTATSVADATSERDTLSVLMQRAGVQADDIHVSGKSKLVEFTAAGSEGVIRRLREMLSGRAFMYPGLWTRVETAQHKA